MNIDFTNCRVVVTGGTSGIGLATARMYHQAGAAVTISGTRKAADYDEDLSAFDYIPLNLEDNASIDSFIANLGAVDILVNNAGLAFASQGLDEHDPDIFARAVQMHLVGGYRLAHGVIDKIADSKLSGGGSVVSIASVTSFMGVDLTLGYGAAKTGVLGMVRGMAVDLGKRNIRVNAVAAGLTQTGMTSVMFDNPDWLAPTLQRTPLGRLGTPEDIAGAVVFMTSPAAAWITGQVLVVDGGYTIAG